MPVINDDSIRGLSGLIDNLNSLPLKLGVQKNIIARSLRKGGEIMRQRMSEIAPRDTGKYAENFIVTVADQTATGARAKIGASRAAWRGNFNEFGTKHQKAEPTLRPAFDQTKEDVLRAIGEELAVQIEKELGKL
jgi:HK97 gp10 family phage protein